MTDEQIIKALECCSNYCTVGCPLVDIEDIDKCTSQMSKYALDLIKRQQAEIERLQEIANPKCQQCVEQTRKNSFVEFADEFEKRCIASGVYPAVTKNILKNLVKELTEGSK